MSKIVSIDCLSVQQPFADLICAGIKKIENRTWNTSHRGTLLIHASASVKPQRAFNLACAQEGFNILHDDKFEDKNDESGFNIAEIAKDENYIRQLAMLTKWEYNNERKLNSPMRTGAVIGIVNLVDVIPPQ